MPYLRLGQEPTAPAGPSAPVVGPIAPVAPSAPSPPGAIAAPTAPAPGGTSSPPTAPVPSAGPTQITHLRGGRVPVLSPMGQVYWTAMRPKLELPQVRALRILMEGELPADQVRILTSGPKETRPQGAPRGVASAHNYGREYRPLEWLFEWPTDLIVSVVPNATTERVLAARAALRPGWASPAVVRPFQIDDLEQQIARIDRELAKLEDEAAELDRYRGWIQSVVDRFQQYLAWFARHQEKKANKVKVASAVMGAISTAAAFIPVVGTAVSLAVSAVDMKVQLDAARDALAALEAAGAQITAGKIAINAMAAYEVTAQELIEAILYLRTERENKVTVLELLQGLQSTATARLAPLATTAQTLHQVRPDRWGQPLLFVGAAAAVLWLIGRRRR